MENVLSVSEYNQFINDRVGSEPVIVEGEISNSREIPGRNFRYFDIKDDQAVAKCFQGFWNSEKIELENGMLVRVFGFSSVQRNGSLVIDVREIYLMGKGDLMMNYLKLKKKLDEEGLFSDNVKKALPRFPKAIGLIAGKNSSAYHDVVSELSERWPGSNIYFHPSKVQGIYAKQEVNKAIRYFNTKKLVDVLIIARGGGSMEDLQAFDSEDVVREIFASKIPTISAIGHEDHWTLADFVADKRAKTPTKAAQLAVPSYEEIMQRMEYYENQALQLTIGKIASFKQEISHKIETSTMLFSGFLQIVKENLEGFGANGKNAMLSMMDDRKEMLKNRINALELLNPRNILDRGYAVLEKDGARLRSVRDIKLGEKFRATLHDGFFEGTINHKKETNETNQENR